MSEVDLLLPQESLNCGVPQNISQQTTDDDERNGEPSGDEIINENGKHLEKREFVVKPDGNVGGGVLDVNSCERKRKHRRGKKRKWRPYCKLSWDERREVDERDARRANRVRAEMCAYGHTLAPYNTTQFLMEDHGVYDPYHVNYNGHRNRENSVGSSSEHYSSPEDEDEFLQREFTETYENIHAERLSNMTKNELVQELMNMEDRLEELQKKLQVAQEKQQTEVTDSEVQTPCFREEQVVKLAVFRAEIQKLTKENELLRRENDYLRTQIPEEDEEEDVS